MQRSLPLLPVRRKSHRALAMLLLTFLSSLVIGAMGPAVAIGGPLFAAPYISFEGLGGGSMLTADVNGDGTLDVMFAGGSITVVLTDGEGRFEEKRSNGTGGGGAAIGDLNGDGKPDVAMVSHDGNGVTVRLGNGDGTFGTNADFETGGYPTALGIADLNGDGRSDLVTAKPNANTISVLLGNGDGTFVYRADYYTGLGPVAVAARDLNGDGRPDVMTLNSSAGSISVLRGVGDGSFEAKTDFEVASASSSFGIGDLNGDDKLDLVMTNSSSNTVSVMLGIGDGTFAPKTDHDTGDGPLAAVIGDINGDGAPDLATANSRAKTVSVLLGVGNGNFAARTDFEAGGRPVNAVLGDLNSDGRLDIAVTNFEFLPPPVSRRLSILFGNGDGSFGSKRSVDTGEEPQAVGIGDFNRDRIPDLVSRGPFGLSVLLGEGDGGFGGRVDHILGFAPAVVAVGDLNGDDKLDLFTSTSAGLGDSGSPLVLFGKGDGSFEPSPESYTWNAVGPAVIGDVNGDAWADVVMAIARGYVSVLLGTGNGRFVHGGDTGVGHGDLTSIALGDLNRDGRTDLVAVGEQAGTVLFGNGNLNYPVRIHFERALSVAIGDLNGDGNPDLVTPYYLRFGDGTGNLGEQTYIGTNDLSRSVVIGDLNADGKPDLAVSDPSGTVSVVLGDGAGGFSSPAGYGAGESPGGLASGDLNRDGRLDLVTTNQPTHSISVLLNIGPVSNAAPDCAAAAPSVSELWPPNQRMTAIGINGVVDADGDPVTITVTGVTQDEPVDAGAGSSGPDAQIVAGQAWVRAERGETGNGRVYRISFTADDGRGAHCEDAVDVCVPHDRRRGRACVDDGQRYNSLASVVRARADAEFDASTPGSNAWLRVTSLTGGQATVEYSLPEAGDVSLAIYDVAGRRVAGLVEGRQTEGLHRVDWDRRGLGPGIYFVRLRSGTTTLDRVAPLLR